MKTLAQRRSFRGVVIRLSELFAVPIREVEGRLVMTLEKDVGRHLSSFPGDPVGFESFVNHVHLEDVLGSDAGTLKRADLIGVGLRILQVWAERLRPLLGGREVLFYLGGPRGVMLRFHVARKEAGDWIDRSNKAFLKQEKIRVFRLSEAGLVEEGGE